MGAKRAKRAHLAKRAKAGFVVLCLALGALVSEGRPRADTRHGGAKAAPASPGLPSDVAKRLRSGDDAQVKAALDDVRVAGRGGAPLVPVIVDALERGLSPTLTQAAIETLGDTEAEGASLALAWYSKHRNVAIRRAAVQALARTRGTVATTALRAALSDPDPAVRALAATGLGTLNAREAVGDLFVALDHRVAEAAASIGQICVGGECDKLAGKLGSVPFDVVTSGLDRALARPPADVADDIKVKIVARVRELGTGQANRFLRGVQSKWPKKGSPRVRQAIDQAVIATSGSPGAEEASP
ncbi:MAG TPA: HEAT repeat domain-containing protein [Polyangiaceae bacterium]|nr:HEAT repeat domain-containing protein [Polyangiaceae bacterium]